MARYAYDVNTTQRYIDVHKQFQGGLKTVDTDDALGAVFLREAENVSLSEFGFIEKRYGTYENFKIQTGIVNLQGYWEFLNYTIYAADGFFYVDGNKVELLYKENDEWRYPTTLFQQSASSECVFLDTGSVNVTSPTSNPSQTQPTCQDDASYYTGCYPSNEDPDIWVCRQLEADTKTIYIPEFQTTRDINGVNINNVMYFFTGTYPIYAKEVHQVVRLTTTKLLIFM
jgi:hypothetical protein